MVGSSQTDLPSVTDPRTWESTHRILSPIRPHGLAANTFWAAFRLGRDFFGYNCEADQGVGPERQGQENIGGVSPTRDQDATDPGIVGTRVKGVPLPPKINLDPGREIHGRERRRKPDVADVTRAVPGRDVQTAAERKRQMGVVAAAPTLLGIGLSGRAGRARVL